MTTTIVTNSSSGPEERNYYCSLKFRFLKIDLESETTYNCHASAPHTIDFGWLEQNRGNLFNTPVNLQERQMMLENRRNSSCEQNCWRAEDLGGVSPRINQNGLERTHTTPFTAPEIIDLTINTNCNLTCSYCCKEFSSSWRRDILKNGDYPVGEKDRYQLTNKDKILANLSQPEVRQRDRYNKILDEIVLVSPSLKRLVVTGGEPLLDNQLIELITKLNMSEGSEINIYTGLGVSMSRFQSMVEKIKRLNNLTLIISAECTDAFHEFNRYGSKWDDFLNKVKYLKENGIYVIFQSTLTNLTIFGFSRFYKHFESYDIKINFAYTPKMMSLNVLDARSKSEILESIQHLPEDYQDKIKKSIVADPTDQQRKDIGNFLLEFVKRRPELDLSIYPERFLIWTGINYVV